MLIHELGKLRGTEKFFNSGDDGTDIYEILWGNKIRILSSHTFADDAFHTCHTDTELILEEFADGSDAAIAEVVDIIRFPETCGEVEDVGDSGANIGDADSTVVADREGRRTEDGKIAAIGADFDRNGEIDAFTLGVSGEVKNFLIAVIGDIIEHILSNECICADKKFAGFRVDEIFSENSIKDSIFPAQLFSNLESPDCREIVSFRIKKL